MKKNVQPKCMDATDYLFSTEANKMRLLKAIENADKGENLTEINLTDFKKQLAQEYNFEQSVTIRHFPQYFWKVAFIEKHLKKAVF